MSDKICIGALLEILVAEEQQLRDQRVHLTGQLAHNQRMQEVLKEQLQKIEDAPKPKTSRKPKK